jgi:hypothetical protein
MKLPSKADLQNTSNRELEGMKEEIRRFIADCEQQRRRGCSALEDIRRVQAQRRIRPSR